MVEKRATKKRFSTAQRDMSNRREIGSGNKDPLLFSLWFLDCSRKMIFPQTSEFERNLAPKWLWAP